MSKLTCVDAFVMHLPDPCRALREQQNLYRHSVRKVSSSSFKLQLGRDLHCARPCLDKDRYPAARLVSKLVCKSDVDAEVWWCRQIDFEMLTCVLACRFVLFLRGSRDRM